MNPQQNPIIIIGMHRSGTSMLTRFIEESGIFMGYGRGKNDEPAFFQKINNWALLQAGATWDNPHNLQFMNEYLLSNMTTCIENYMNSPFLYKYLGFKNTLSYKTLNNVDFRWGWKDPRNTLLLPLWIKMFPNAKFVHIYRNPIDVAESLRSREYQLEKNFTRTSRIKRKEMFLSPSQIYYQSSRIHDIYEGIKLWEDYIALALGADQYSNNVIHIKYEDFLNNPEKILQNLSAYLEIEYNYTSAKSILSKIDPTRAYAFIDKPDLIKVYQSAKERTLIKQLNYSSIL